MVKIRLWDLIFKLYVSTFHSWYISHTAQDGLRLFQSVYWAHATKSKVPCVLLDADEAWAILDTLNYFLMPHMEARWHSPTIDSSISDVPVSKAHDSVYLFGSVVATTDDRLIDIWCSSIQSTWLGISIWIRRRNKGKSFEAQEELMIKEFGTTCDSRPIYIWTAIRSFSVKIFTSFIITRYHEGLWLSCRNERKFVKTL